MADPPADLHYSNGVLRNLFGAADSLALERVERVSVKARYIQLRRGLADLPAEFGWERLKSTHRYLFQDVYPWAGVPRTWDIAKVTPSGSLVHFLDCERVETEARASFDQIAADDYLADFGDDIPDVLAAIYSRLNVIHPFPEGNGRTLRAFLRDFSGELGRPLEFDVSDRGELLAATIDAARGDLDALVAAFRRAARHR